MKTLILFLATCLGLVACGNTPAKDNAAAAPERDCVEVLYFHGKQRCATCVAIEQNTRTVIESRFAEECAKGDVVFRIIDLTLPENEALAEKYEVTWSSLWLTRWTDGTDRSENLTEYAFANARTAPETFRAELEQKIREMLK